MVGKRKGEIEVREQERRNHQMDMVDTIGRFACAVCKKCQISLALCAMLYLCTRTHGTSVEKYQRLLIQNTGIIP